MSGKGRAEKEVLSLPETTQAAITAWLRVRGTTSGPLFLTLGPRRNRRRSRRRFTSRGIYRIVSELGEQAGAKVWPHGLRHTAITSAVEAAQEHGVTLDEVRQFSRHKNINTLLVYRDRVRDVQGKLAALVAGTVEAAWLEIVALLEPRGMLTPCDATMVELTAKTIVTMRHADAVITREGSTVRTASGYLQQRPEVAIQHKARLLLKQLLGELGMSPASRSNVDVPPAAVEGSAFQKFLERGRRIHERQ